MTKREIADLIDAFQEGVAEGAFEALCYVIAPIVIVTEIVKRILYKTK